MAYKVLLVEDNNDCRDLFAMLFRHLGLQVLQANDGEIAVQKALSEKPDIIFMDLSMPKMSGIEATTCLRESVATKNTPIIICTGWMARQQRERALESGAHEVVTKPISIKQIETVLTRYLPAESQSVQVH
jgi:CheY-like chemotaxis protein